MRWKPSSLRISNAILSFPGKYGIRIMKRIFYNYFLRDFNVCSLQLIAGGLLMAWSLIFGGLKWYQSISSGVPAPSGTVMLAALPLILSTQFLLEAIRYDISQIPSKPLHRLIAAAGSDSNQPEDSTSG
jgi:hypothetical protein